LLLGVIVAGCGARTGLDVEDETVLRPIGPLSTSKVTSRRPTLHFRLGALVDSAEIEVSRSRDFASLELSARVTGQSYRPDRPLDPGPHFWRLRRAGQGSPDQTSPVWEFLVGHGDAPVDSSWGSVLDLDGSGRTSFGVLPLRTTAAEPSDKWPGCLGIYRDTGTAFRADWTLTGPGDLGSEFGVASASAGDVNGDGYGDLIVGADCDAKDKSGRCGPGRVYVYHGGPTGLLPAPAAVLAGTTHAIRFGRQVQGAGDLNGDGYGDVLVAALELAASGGDRPGTVSVYLGGPQGISSTPAAVLAGLERMQFPVGVFGEVQFIVRAAGDLNGDGYGDIVTTSWCAATSTGTCRGGRVYVYLGGREGISTTPAVTLFDPDTSDPRVAFGMGLDSGTDLDGDGYADILVGATPCLDQDCDPRGRVYAYFGGPDGIATRPSLTWVESDLPASAADGFGSAMSALGDVNGDGFDDVAVNTPTCGLFTLALCAVPNRAHLYMGGSPPKAVPSALLVSPHPSSGFPDRFGLSIAPGDLDGDAVDDVLGAFIAFDAPSELYLYPGSRQGLPPLPARTQPYPTVGANCR
jgi:hypothetical protein